MYFMIKYQITDDESDLDKGLSYSMKSHSIIENNFDKTVDFFINSANEVNFEIIPFIYMASGKSDQAAQFLIKNKNQICRDGTYECLNIWRLRDYREVFYSNYYYDEVLKISQIFLNYTDAELANQGEKNQDMKVYFYYYVGLIQLKRENYDIAIENYNNALEIINQSKEEDWNYWLAQINSKLGFIYYYKKNYEKAAPYFFKSAAVYRFSDDQEKRYLMGVKSYYGISELLIGNLDKSNETMTKVESWVKTHPLKTEDNEDYLAYALYWPLHIYYDNMKQNEEASKYLNMAYEIVGKEKIEKYHQHPEKDTHPKFFYCRDIIKAYESSLNH